MQIILLYYKKIEIEAVKLFLGTFKGLEKIL